MADLPARRAILGALALGVASSRAQSAPLTATVIQPTPHNFATLLARTEAAITAHDMLILARASASEGAAKRGISIPGNAVFLVFRNDFAVRMLAASIAAGIEAPIPIYLTENNIKRTKHSRNVGQLVAATHEIHGLQMGKAGGAQAAAIGFVAAIADQINPKLALGRFNGDIHFTSGNFIAFSIKFEMVDQCFH